MDSEPTIYDYYLILKKRWKIGLCIFLIISLINIFISLSFGITYQAKCSVYRKIATMPTLVSEIQLATSYNIARFLGVSQNDLKVELVRDSNILNFSYANRNKDKALNICKKWLPKYFLISTRVNADKEDKDTIKIITKPYVVKVDNRLKNIITGIFLGLFGSVGFIFFLDYLLNMKKEK